MTVADETTTAAESTASPVSPEPTSEELQAIEPTSPEAAEEIAEPDVSLSEQEITSIFEEPVKKPESDPDIDRKARQEALIKKQLTRLRSAGDEFEQREILDEFPQLKEEVAARFEYERGTNTQIDIDHLVEQKVNEKLRAKEQYLEFKVEFASLPEKVGISIAEFNKNWKTKVYLKAKELRATPYGKHMPAEVLLRNAAHEAGLFMSKASKEAAELATRKSNMALPSASGRPLKSGFRLLSVEEVDALTDAQRSEYIRKSTEEHGEMKYKE